MEQLIAGIFLALAQTGIVLSDEQKARASTHLRATIASWPGIDPGLVAPKADKLEADHLARLERAEEDTQRIDLPRKP